ncbi:MAG: hypothetical protein HUU06_13185, partial [Planctomycetaceae bacterium]|nr:hypothetical protein [Planctomycetaceae bacterium]
PAAGARVGTRSSHRGPWTVAGPDGRFRLDGAEPFDHLVAMAPITDPVPEGIRPPQVEFPAVPGVFATVRLPAEGRPWPTEEERKAEREEAERVREAVERGVDPGPPVPEGVPSIRVRVEAAPGAFPFGPVRVLLVRDGDGAAKVASLSPWPAADRRIAVDPGTWTVTAGSRAGRFRAASRRVVVGEGEVEAVFTLEPNPAWRPRFLEGAGGGAERESEGRIRGKYFITTEEGRVEGEPRLDGEGFPDGFLHVPAEGPFAVEFEAEDGRGARVFLEGPPEGEGPSFLLGPPIPWEEEEEPTARPRRFPPALLRVLLPDGTPAAWADGCARYPAPPDPRFPGFVRAEEGWFRLDETGATEISFDGGERVEVEAEGGRGEGLLPLAARIEGPGPWTLRWPTGEVRVRAVDEAGDPLAEFSVSLGGWETLDAVEGSVLLRGVGAGPLRFWVAAEGRRMRDLRIVLAEGERREVVLRMNRAGEGR